MKDLLWKLLEITQAFWGVVLAVCAFVLMIVLVVMAIACVLILLSALLLS